MTSKLPRYFLWIDAMRGLAAVVVVVFHYHHFYLADYLARPDLPPVASFPYAGFLWPFYESGHLAVRLFWVISGFVFAHVYLDRVVSAWQYIVARVARLYPLHLLTLLYMATIQAISANAVGHWQIYGNNDARHFFLQIGMVADAVKQSRGFSFNGPIWSVSVELGAYALFFVALSLVRKLPIIAPIALCLLGFYIAQTGWDIPVLSFSLFTCIGFFFAGVLLYSAFNYAGGGVLTTLALCLVCALAAVAAYYASYEIPVLVFASCAIILALAALDTQWPNAANPLRPLGNVSYSVYLVHVPVQATILLVADIFFDGTRQFADSWWLLPVFLMSSILLAHYVYVSFERPAGKFVRKVMGN